jgi:protein TonB
MANQNLSYRKRSEKPAPFLLLACLLIAAACDSGRQEPPIPTPPPPTPIPQPEPLETVTMEDSEIIPIKEASGRSSSPVGIPCPWASIWEQADGAKPLPVGGTIKSPKILHQEPPAFPPRKTATRGTPVLEVIIDMEGNVAEATMVQSVEPPWPEGEAALLAAVKHWKYEPSKLDGNLIPICMKITLSIEWK